jgi:hypothetical protein
VCFSVDGGGTPPLYEMEAIQEVRNRKITT